MRFSTTISILLASVLVVHGAVIPSDIQIEARGPNTVTQKPVPPPLNPGLTLTCVDSWPAKNPSSGWKSRCKRNFHCGTTGQVEWISTQKEFMKEDGTLETKTKPASAGACKCG
ncbi:hypothetical protein C8J56DRAFT_1070522 [Mycena floridula]|nr:hypothetical protein C8J56DRAFT_1070522 [Mycena floridula]